MARYTEEPLGPPGLNTRDIGVDAGFATPSPDQDRQTAREHYERRIARLEDELDRMVKLLQMARESLENELFSGFGYKKLGISSQDLGKLSTLTKSLDSAVSAKIRYDKAAKELASSMTPEEEYESVVAYVRTLPSQKLLEFRRAIEESTTAAHREAARLRRSAPEADQ